MKIYVVTMSAIVMDYFVDTYGCFAYRTKEEAEKKLAEEKEKHAGICLHEVELN